MTTHDAPFRIGISTCLLGEAVRHDGGHKRDPYLVETLGEMVEWVPVCPEVDIGLGTPREPIRLVRDQKELDGIRLVSKSGVELSKRMRRYARKRTHELAQDNVSGYIVKKASPSCGMARVKVWNASDLEPPARNGRGVFTAELLRQYPNMPVEEEGRLRDPSLRENFFERIFAYRSLRKLFSGHWTNNSVVRFHTDHKLTLMAHSLPRYRKLGRLVANVKAFPRAEFSQLYEDEFMAAMKTLATTARHTNVLMHALGHFKRRLDSKSRAEILAIVDDYQKRLVPRIVPLTLIRHHAQVLAIFYLLGQTYLNPTPKELALLNHV